MEPCYTCDRRHSPDVSEVLMRADGFSLQPRDILNLLQHSSNDLHWVPGVGRIGRDYVVKHMAGARLAEAENSEFARQNTNIPVPEVFLVFCIRHRTYIVSKFIEGTPLRDCWGVSNAAQKVAVVATIASYIRQLQALKSSRPGPVNPLSKWRGRWFTEYDIGPLNSHTELVEWLNHKREVCERIRGLTFITPPFSSDYPLVFTHGDIAPRNFIMDHEGLLWLIDWDRAGWYPVYMEYANIAVERDDLENPIVDFEEWVQSVTGAIDCYDKELQMLRSIVWALDAAPLA